MVRRGAGNGRSETNPALAVPGCCVVGRPGRGGRGAGERPAGVESLALWCSCVVRVLLPGEESEGLGGACVPALGVARGPHGLRPALGPCQVQGDRAGAQCTVPAVLSLGSPPSQPQWLPCQAKAMGRRGLCCPRSAAPALHHGRPGLGSCQREPSACSGRGWRPWGGSPTLPPVPGSLLGVPLPLCEALGRVAVGRARLWCCGARAARQLLPRQPGCWLAVPRTVGQCRASSRSVFFSSFKKDLGVGDGHQNLEMSPVDLWVGTKPVCLEQWT